MQIHNSNWNYNKMGMNEVGMVMVMKMQRLIMMGMMPWPPMIHVAARMMPFCKFPLQIPSGGEVSASCGVSECRISDPSSRGETI